VQVAPRIPQTFANKTRPGANRRLIFANDCAAVRPHTSRSVWPVRTGHPGPVVVVNHRRFPDDCGPTGSDASRAVDSISAIGSIGLLTERKRTCGNHTEHALLNLAVHF
jgi:hypothetical protein